MTVKKGCKKREDMISSWSGKALRNLLCQGLPKLPFPKPAGFCHPQKPPEMSPKSLLGFNGHRFGSVW